MRFELDLLEVENDIHHVFHHVRKGLELVVGSGDLDCGDRSAFQRGKQHAAQGVPYGVPVTGLERLGDEFGVGIRP